MPSPEMGPEVRILRYFLRNPAAVDTLEGIAAWCLVDEDPQRATVQQTETAVGLLVERGFLLEIATRPSGVRYRLNRLLRNEAERYAGLR